MPPTPVYSVIRILRYAIVAALDPLTTTGVYWVQAKQGVALPFVIAQSQDNGGRGEKTVGALSWSGLVTIRALAASQSAAETLLEAVAPGMASLSSAGYTITTIYDRPITIPPRDDTWQCGHIWRVHISST
jgi:hypothetical protein